MLSLDDLDRVFPDARFVMTHRDPTDVMLSVVDVYADIVGGFTDHVDRRYLGQLNVGQWSAGVDRAVKFRDGRRRRPVLRHRLPSHAGRPDRRGARLYDWLGEPVTDQFEAGMRSGGRRTPRTASRSPRADPEDFGLDFDRDPSAVCAIRRPFATLAGPLRTTVREALGMAIDLTGGIDPAREYMFAERRTTPRCATR